MKKYIKYIVIFIIILLIIISVLLIKINQKNVEKQEINLDAEPGKTAIEEEENILVVALEEEEEEQQQQQQPTEEPEEPQEPEPVKDASTLTQEIYNRNSPIGTLYIPKTKLNTQVYSSVTVDELEKMPCFLYTTGGLSKPGITLFVGHNKRNGKLFSNNKNLEVGDEFYFTDYEGTELKYTIYSKFITTEDDISFLNSEVDVPVIALSCCTDASDENRIIILGRADES